MYKNDTPERIFVSDENHWIWLSSNAYQRNSDGLLYDMHGKIGYHYAHDISNSVQRPVLFIKKQMKAHLLKVR